MTVSLPPALATLLEKAARDNGLDRRVPADGGWLRFTSTQVPLDLWLGTLGEGLHLVAVSRVDVARALPGTPIASPLPPGAAGARTAPSLPELDRLIRRAFQLARALPDEPLHAFERETATLPRTTEAERLVVQRVGQGCFRRGLLDYWEGRCAVTGLAIPELLRASHSKPWAECTTDAERLDVFNGFLLAAHLDAAFDQGFITFRDDGVLVVSPLLDAASRELLGLDRPLRVRTVTDGHRRYLAWHRERVFRATGGPAARP